MDYKLNQENELLEANNETDNIDDKYKIHIGLDLGIASVGWSVVNENKEIIACGSHLFQQLGSGTKFDEYGEGIRGQYRRKRRNLRRKKQRKLDFLNMIDKYSHNNQVKLEQTHKLSSKYKEAYQSIFGFSQECSSTDFLVEINNKNNPTKYDLWTIYKKGFKQELTPKELFLFLYFKLSLRGCFYKTIPSEHNKTLNDYNYEHSLLKNVYEDNYYQARHKYRDKANSDEQYSIEWNWKDIEYILNKCSYITPEFINDYKQLFLSKVPYNKGPGYKRDGLNPAQTSNKPSQWGIKYINNKPEYDNLWENKIRLCKIDYAKKYIQLKGSNKHFEIKDKEAFIKKVEHRMNLFFALPQICNLINQLSSVKVKTNNTIDINDINPNGNLSKSQIIKLINHTIIKDENLTLNRIAKILNCNVSDISSYPTKKDKVTAQFEELIKVRTYFNKDNPIIKQKDVEEDFILNKFKDYLFELDKIRFQLACKYYEDQKEKGSNLSESDKLHNKECKNNIDFQASINEAKQKVKELNWSDINDLLEINYEQLCNFNQINEQDLTGTWNFGESAYNDYLNYFFDSINDYESVDPLHVYYKDLIRLGNQLSYEIKSDSIYISKQLIKNQDFISPNTKNTINQAIIILNKLLSTYIYNNPNNVLKSICIESTYDDGENISKGDFQSSVNHTLLSKIEKENIIKFQNEMEKLRKDAKDKIKEYNLSDSNETIKKVMLWIEQGGNDPYSPQKPLDINNIDSYQIDHIIPRSISHNNNWENLVLTSKNADKSNKTPYLFLNNNDYKTLKDGLWVDLYYPEKNKNKNDSKKDNKNESYKTIKQRKYKNLTNENNSFATSFITRNLSETTYAIRILKNGLVFTIQNLKDIYADGYKQNNQKHQWFSKIKDCKIRTLSGTSSQILRKQLQIQKQRDVDASHHAVDASICAFYSADKQVQKMYELIDKYILIKMINQNNKFDNTNLSEKEISVFNLPKIHLKDLWKKDINIYKQQFDKIKCIYSFKPVSIFNKQFEHINKQIRNEKISKHDGMNKLKILINNVHPRKIFSSENFHSYYDKSDDNQKYEIVHLNIFTDKDDEKYKIYEIFYELFKNYYENQNLTLSLAIVDKVRKEFKMLTNEQVLIDIFNILVKHTPDCYLQEYLNNNSKLEKAQIKKTNIFAKYIDHLQQNSNLSQNENLMKDINDVTNDNNPIENQNSDGYLKYLLTNYLIVLANDNTSYYKVKYLKIVDNDKLANIKEVSNLKSYDKSIFDKEKSNKFTNRKFLWGNETKCLAIIKYKIKNKEKIDFFKINQMNEIVDAPNENDIIEIIKYIDYDKWFKIGDDIFRISNFNTNGKKIHIQCKSRQGLNIKQNDYCQYSYNSFSNKSNELDKKIFKYLTK